MAHVGILGCGWLGLELGRRLHNEGFHVIGSTRGDGAHHMLRDAGITPVIVNLENAYEGDREILNADVLILAFPPGRAPEIEHRMAQRMDALLDALEAHRCRDLIMISSTSVYAAANQPVTEEDSRLPDKASGRALRSAENRLLNHPDFRFTSVRAAGLIGGDRRPGRFLAGKENVSGGDDPVNLVHRDDVVGIVLAVIRQNVWNTIFNAVAPAHPTRKEYYVRAAKELGLTPPTFDNKPAGNGKEVSGERVREVLGYTYLHPDPTVIL